MGSIDFFEEDIEFTLKNPRKTKRWIAEVISQEEKKLHHLNYIFCSDAYLLRLNEQYLKHRTLTDIITFDHGGSNEIVEGDIFISIERVKANALDLGIPIEWELHRVIIHGVLHLMGHRDKTPSEKATMRKKEDACLSLRNLK